MKLEENLTFAEHVDYVKRKTIGKIKFLGRLNNVLSQATMLMLYKSLILPVIDYASGAEQNPEAIFRCATRSIVWLEGEQFQDQETRRAGVA